MKISIITINYNNCSGLRKTIESVINQTFHDFEFIIIDGGSSDGSAEILKEYDSKISYWVSERDNGIYNAMNKGIRRAQGEFLNFINSGDTYYDNHTLELVANQLGSDILVGRDYHFNEKTQQGFASILPTRISMITFYIETLPHQSAFIRRSLFVDEMYDESLHICSDWLFYIHKIVVNNCNVKTTNQIICRREQGGISTLDNGRKVKEERERILKEFLPNGVYADYATLSNLDRATLYKLFNICNNPKLSKLLTLAIKIIYKIFR